ncbi:MAG: UDP-N-acetylmuramate dehydrogenase [Prevotella sp.]|nr:UDP-N-acetylmuramate dehydrogenase [Prevotella sp.]
MRDERNYSLLRHNTFGIDAHCRRFLEYYSTEEAQLVARTLCNSDCPCMVLGAGSNLLLTGDYDGTVVRSAIRGISLTERPDGSAILRCGSGETWDDVVAWTVSMGFIDLANLSLIPGDVGASAVQNIGAYGAEAGQFISEVQAVEIATAQCVSIPTEACCYGYRDSRFKHEWKGQYLITHVCYHLRRDYTPKLEYGNICAVLAQQGIDSPTPQQLRQTIIDIRRAKLPEPEELGNAGSFFMNPVVSRHQFEALIAQHPQMPHYNVDEDNEKIPAGWLIDQCGWKGRTMGRTGVYEKQALVLVNRGGATGQEIVALCQAIQKDVKECFGIELRPEVNIV